MTVARILANKGRNVVTTQPHRTLLEISRELLRHKIGAMVIADANDNVVGLISERDIVEAIASHGPDALSDAASRHMVTNPRTVDENDTVDETMQTMTLERRRHLPVLRDGRLVGLVSIGDVVKYRIEAIEREHEELRVYIATA
jgi:CBS domain-containing protein